MQLATKVALHDVLDVEAFVRATITKGRLRLTLDEREELVAEGLRIMAALANTYEPGKNGLNAENSKYSGYAAKFLPGKLSDAWHRLQEHHRLVTVPDGGRKWHYGEKPTSLDALTSEAPDAADRVVALQTEDTYDSDMAQRLRTALDERWEYDRELTVKLGALLGLGYNVADAGKTLRIESTEAMACVDRIRCVAHQLQEAA